MNILLYVVLFIIPTITNLFSLYRYCFGFSLNYTWYDVFDDIKNVWITIICIATTVANIWFVLYIMSLPDGHKFNILMVVLLTIIVFHAMVVYVSSIMLLICNLDKIPSMREYFLKKRTLK